MEQNYKTEQTFASACASTMPPPQLKEGKNKMPVYTHGQELFNAISHIVGGGLGVVFAVIACLVAAKQPTAAKFVAIGIYSLSMIVLYTMSSLYHFLPQGRAKRVFRIFDHCTIYLLIAGCYSPFCLVTFGGQTVGIVVFAVEWVLSVVGIALNATMMNRKPVKVFSMVSYLIMGWMIVLLVKPLIEIEGISCFLWLLLGGIFYTSGMIFYGLGKKNGNMHCVWHLFVLLGSIFQFVSILMIL